MLSYPSELPLPLQAQYSESVQPNIKRSSMSDGYVRQRKITSNALHSLSVSWYFTAEQLVIFQEFFSRINEGADWFLMKVPSQKYVAGQTSFDVIERSVRFQSGKYTSTLQFFSDERWLWKITAALDLNLNDFLEAETEDDSWNYDSEYEFKFEIKGGVPVVSGKKKCFICSAVTPSIVDDYLRIHGTYETIGLDVYTEGVQLTAQKNVLEIDTEYEGIDANTFLTKYYYFGRASSVDAALRGVGLTAGRNYSKEITAPDLFKELTNNSYTSLTRISQNTYSYVIPVGTKIQRRDIFINDIENDQLKYYLVMNDVLTYEAVFSGVRNWTAVFYQIGDPYNRGLYNNINLYSIKVKNSLFKAIPEGV